MEVNSSLSDFCKICIRQCDAYENHALLCEGECKQKIHLKCLKNGPPSSLIGDVFFDLQCAQCYDEEIVVRQKLPWLTTVMLTLYNLRRKSSGLSRRGYFHWKSDISTFINNHWDQLFTRAVKRKKNWVGTISGTLSHYSAVFFKSGTSELGDQGWWKLIDNDPPEILVEKYNRLLEQKKQNSAKLKGKPVSSPKSESNLSGEDENSNGNENCQNNKIQFITNIKSEPEIYNEIPKSIDTHEEFKDFLDLDIDLSNIEDDFPSFNLNGNGLSGGLPFQVCSQLSDAFISECFQNRSEDFKKEPSDVPMTETFQEIEKTENEKSEESDENNKPTELPPPVPSLFRESSSRPWPWDESIKFNPDDVRPMMSEREEEFKLQKIEQYKHLLDTAPPSVRRLYRKLAVRKLKRQYGLPIFNIDTFGKDSEEKTLHVRKGNAVLDRFISKDISICFEQRLQGHCEPTSVHSPYTNRLLKPFIRRDATSHPLWMRVMCELLIKVNGKTPGWKLKRLHPIDYSYIRPQHIPAVNSLCTQFFWPGVDLTECLQYPDFTCVVLYKKVVIGFATMVPDVGYNEAYISFLLVRPEWRGAGIGKFMLYHLIQTCMGKDITLHVSASNPAIILYNKFGFKQEEFVQDFYDKYIPPSSKESKHALFLRLSR